MKQLSFHGGVRGVTGSCYLLENEKGKILIDCGMHQGERMCSKINYEPFDFDPSQIDAVIITHAHYDHTGRLPLLIERGFRGKIYMTAPTKELSRHILEDAMRIMQENAEHCGDEVLYSAEDLKKVFSLTTGLGYHTEFEPVRGMRAMFHDAGHILGSAYISVDIEGERFIFSGDLGNDDVPILPDTEILESADYIVCESTYGDKDHHKSSERKQRLLDALDKTLPRGGTAIIPAFSIERTQELLYLLNELCTEGQCPQVPVFLDSPLAIKATEVYEKYSNYLRFDKPHSAGVDQDFFSFPGLHVTMSVDDSKEINHYKGAKIIIAGSGMMTGGRVVHHLKQYLSDEKSAVIIIGYQADHTLGRKIQDGAEAVEIHRQHIKVRARIYEIESFSAHAGRTKLATWVQPKSGPAKKIFLVHGDDNVKPMLAKHMQEKGVMSEIIIPQFQGKFEL